MFEWNEDDFFHFCMSDFFPTNVKLATVLVRYVNQFTNSTNLSV